jgi:outer membrane protein OmpA-like peptidoglycan-associated protein
LRDPLAADPSVLRDNEHIDPNSVEFQLEPYYSLNDEFVEKRAIEMLAPPKGVSLKVHSGVLVAAGPAPADWVSRLKDRAEFVPGVRDVDTSQLEDADRPEIGKLEAALKSIVITFPIGVAQVEPDQEAKFSIAAEQIKSLLAKSSPAGPSFIVEIIGHTDTSGTEGLNMSLSQQRAEFALRKLVEAGVARRYLQPHGVGTSQPVRGDDATSDGQLERSVTLHVMPAKPNQDH